MILLKILSSTIRKRNNSAKYTPGHILVSSVGNWEYLWSYLHTGGDEGPLSDWEPVDKLCPGLFVLNNWFPNVILSFTPWAPILPESSLLCPEAGVFNTMDLKLKLGRFCIENSLEYSQDKPGEHHLQVRTEYYQHSLGTPVYTGSRWWHQLEGLYHLLKMRVM